MKKNKLLALNVLIIGILWLSLAPNAKALSFTYSDNIIAYLVISGPDFAKPGNTESYSVSGSFAVVTNDFVHIRLWLDTSSRPSNVILDEDALPPGTYGAGYAFTKTYNVSVPNDAVNDKCIYANLTTSIRQFSKFSISLVQNPTYNELQSQISILQTQTDNLRLQINSLQSDKSELQSQISSLNSNVTDLKSVNSNLSAQMDKLQSQLNDIRIQDANATSLSLFAIMVAAVFVIATIYLAVRKPKVKTA